MMLANEETMSYNHAWGGTIPWPEDKWSGWYDYWIACHEDKRYYRYLKNEDGQFVGEIAYHYDAEIQHEIADVVIYSKYRRKGYISSFTSMVLQARKIAVTCKPLFHQGRGLSKNKIARLDFENSAVCIGFVVIPQKTDTRHIVSGVCFFTEVHDEEPLLFPLCGKRIVCAAQDEHFR